MSEPQPTPVFDSLVTLRERLQTLHQRSPQEVTLESTLVDLIDALEAVHYRARLEIHFDEYSDNHADMRNLAQVKIGLEEVARTLERVCTTRNSYYRW